MQRDFSAVKRLVIKVGTSSLVAPDRSIRLEHINSYIILTVKKNKKIFEDDLVRCLLVRLNEARDEQRLEGRRIVSDLVIARTVLGVGGMFEPVQGRLARQRLAALAPSAELTGQRGQYRVTAQLIVIFNLLF